MPMARRGAAASPGTLRVGSTLTRDFNQIQIAMQILAKAARPQIPAGPADLVDLMTRCWAQDAAERPAFAEVKAALAL